MINPISNPSYLVPPLIALLSCSILATVVWHWGRKSFSSRLFIGLLICVGLGGLVLFGMRSSPDLQRALLWDRALPAFTCATFVLYYHFTIAYTNERGRRRILFASYLFLVFVIAITPTELAIKSMRLEDYGYAPNVGPAAYPTFLAYPLLIAGGTYNLLKRYRTSRSYGERNRLIYLTIGTIFLLLGPLLDAFSNLPPVAIWTNLIFCIICSVVILKYHLLDIRIIIRKSLAYLLMSFIIALPYVSILVFVNQILKASVEPWWIHAIIILLVAIILRPLYTWSQRFVDRLFYRDRYDYLIALEDFIQETHDIRNLSQLTSSLVNSISRALQSSSVQLLLPSSSGDLTVVSSTDESASQLSLGSRCSVLRWMQSNKSLLYRQNMAVIPQLLSLTTKEVNVLNRMGAELLVPIMTEEKQLVGLISLGKKLSQQQYSREDESLVLVAANRMALELENAHLYAMERTMRKELQKRDQQKTEFLHSVAHELKTPLTAITSSAELLGEESLIAPDLRERLINNIRQSASSMNRRVAELLDLARAQIGELSIKPEPLEIARIINEIASQLHILFESKEQILILEIPDSLPKVNADRGKLEQVLFNLLSNANKFSPTGNTVVLRARNAGRKIVVEVEDSAPVVTEEEKGRLFDPYYRSEDPQKRERFPGLGLGLSISKSLVELHQGEIWVESKPNKGNTFAFSLPTLD